MNELTITTDFTDIALPTDLATSQQLNRDLLTLVVALQARVKQLEAELTERLNDSSATSSNRNCSRSSPLKRQ